MIQEFIEVVKPAIKSIHHSFLRITFINGAALYFKGSDKFDSLRGRGLTFCVIDEAAFCHEDVWKKAIRPALSDKQGRAMLISSPNGHNWFKEQYDRCSTSAYQAWKTWRFPSRLNPLLTDEDIEAAKIELSEMDFRQEYLAEFVTKAGLVYDDFSDDNITEDWQFDPKIHDIYLGVDFGYANPSAVVFMGVDRATAKVHQFDEIYVERTPIDQIVDLIYLKLYENQVHMPTAVFTDPAGNAEELSSGISPVDFMRNKGFTVINKGSEISPGLALVRSYIKNAAGQIRYSVDPKCQATIKSLRGYSYKLGVFKIPTELPDKDNIHDHCCDAVRYFFVNKFDHAKYSFESLDQYPYSSYSRSGTVMKRCGICKNVFPSKTPKDMPPLVCNDCSENN